MLKPCSSIFFLPSTALLNYRSPTTNYFCSSTLHFPSFGSIPSRNGCSRDGYYILHLPRQAIARSPLGWAPGLLYTQHRTCAGVLRFASTPVSGGWDFPQWFSVVFCGPHTELSHVVLCGSRLQRELLSDQNPRNKHLSPESPLSRLILLLPQLFESSPFQKNQRMAITRDSEEEKGGDLLTIR